MSHYATLTSMSIWNHASGTDAREVVRRNVESALAKVDDAALDSPDLIALPENFGSMGVGVDDWRTIAEPVPGPTIEAFAAKAREYRTHIVCPLIEEKDGNLHNSAVLIGRKGEIIGVYHKMYPTIGEIDAGVVPGTEAPAWDTDLGKVGCAICFDLNFRDVALSLAEHGAQIVSFNSAYRGGLSTRIWAFDFGWWFVSAIRSENSVILNPLGQVLKESFHYSPIISANVNLDADVFHIDYNHQHLRPMREKYGGQVEIQSLSPEAVFLLTSHHADLTVDDLVEEFGMERRTQYWERAGASRREKLREKGRLT